MQPQLFQYIFLSCIILWPIAGLQASSNICIPPDGQTHVLDNSELHILSDPDLKLSIEDVKDSNFVAFQDYKGSRKNYWIHLPLYTNNEDSIIRTLELKHPRVAYIRLYISGKDKNYPHRISGNGHMNNSGNIPLNTHTFNIGLHKQIQHYYLKVSSTSPALSLALHHPRHFIGQKTRQLVGYALIIGALINLCCINIIMFGRQPIGLSISAYHFFVLISLAFYSGIAKQYLWPGAMEWNEKLLPICFNLSLLAHIAFTLTVFRLNEKQSIFQAGVAIGLGHFIAALLHLFISPQQLGLSLIVLLLSYTWRFWVVLTNWQASRLKSLFFFIGCTFLIVAVLTSVLYNMGFILHRPVTDMQMFLAILISILAFTCTMGIYLREEVENQLIKQLKNEPQPMTSLAILSPSMPLPACCDGLTPKERETVAHLYQGLKIDEIAHQMAVSRATVNFHLKNIYSKLNVNNRMEVFARLNEP